MIIEIDHPQKLLRFITDIEHYNPVIARKTPIVPDALSRRLGVNKKDPPTDTDKFYHIALNRLQLHTFDSKFSNE